MIRFAYFRTVCACLCNDTNMSFLYFFAAYLRICMYLISQRESIEILKAEPFVVGGGKDGDSHIEAALMANGPSNEHRLTDPIAFKYRSPLIVK